MYRKIFSVYSHSTVRGPKDGLLSVCNGLWRALMNRISDIRNTQEERKTRPRHSGLWWKPLGSGNVILVLNTGIFYYFFFDFKETSHSHNLLPAQIFWKYLILTFNKSAFHFNFNLEKLLLQSKNGKIPLIILLLGYSMSKQGEKRSMSKSKHFMKKYERV